MSRIAVLRGKINQLYEAKHEGRADWADWLYTDHVFLVSDTAEQLANRFGANSDLAVAAAMLHDVADTVMNRFDPKHEEETFRIARELLEESGFNESEIHSIVDDAIRLHSCFDGNAPESLEGQVMATADALVHLRSDYYRRGVESMKGKKSVEDIKKWAAAKIERDFHHKIRFDDVREEARPDYEKVKAFFQGLT